MRLAFGAPFLIMVGTNWEQESVNTTPLKYLHLSYQYVNIHPGVAVSPSDFLT